MSMAEEDEDIAKLDAMEETSSLYHVKSLGLSVCSVSILQGRVRVYMGTWPREDYKERRFKEVSSCDLLTLKLKIRLFFSFF